MDRLIQAIVNYSKIEVISYDISEATATSFVTSIEGRITGAGPVYGSILAMPVDAIGPAGKFATLAVSDTKMTPSGATISIINQKIEITDMTAFLAFVKAIMQDDTCGLSLFAKSATIKALMIRKTIEFSKPAEVVGWKGLNAGLVSFKPGKVVVKIDSSSQTSIDLGVANLEMQDKDGRALARLTGQLKVEKGETFHELDISFVPGVESGVKAGDVVRLVGVSGVPQTWLQDAIKFFGVDVVVTKECIEAANF
ncbi:hypothetical protein EG328_008602 [Venturia inaequalis]|nr:hypothetical protein EG327_000606 [Venturia inaequalis]KAE9966824.1 hypothetical protein EG328_008602 [Venturia inaequalis]RDI87525.1 hypothetical protein Vi05172_g2228 [Venturia inaequalis]